MELFRAFHCPSDIAECFLEVLGGHDDAVIFGLAGRLEAAGASAFREPCQARHRERAADGWQPVRNLGLDAETDKRSKREVSHERCLNEVIFVMMVQIAINCIDIDETMLTLAQQALEERGLKDKTHLEKGTTRALPFPDQSMDFAVSFGVFHFNDWHGINESFQEVNRVLRPGQYFMFQARSVNDTEQEMQKIVDTPAGFIGVSAKKP